MLWEKWVMSLYSNYHKNIQTEIATAKNIL